MIDGSGTGWEGNDSLWRVEPKRGKATLVSNTGVGSGPDLGLIFSVAQAVDGSYLAYGMLRLSNSEPLSEPTSTRTKTSPER